MPLKTPNFLFCKLYKSIFPLYTVVHSMPADQTEKLDLTKARSVRLYASAQALLYDIAKRVRSGYLWWQTGEVPAEKILAVYAKLDFQYEVTATSSQRHQRKVRGDASTTLLIWPLRNDPAGYTTRFGFLLLSTEHLDGQVMYDGRSKPVRCNLYANGNAVFHLIPKQVPVERKLHRPGPKSKARKQAQDEPQKPTTSKQLKYEYDWQLSAKTLALMRKRWHDAASSPAELERLRRAYQALPMTSGYRSQFKTVLAETKLMWKKATTPAAVEGKKAIKEGTRADPFSVATLPYIRGFPKLYDDPPVTLESYLAANEKERKMIEQRNRARVQADHAQAAEGV